MKRILILCALSLFAILNFGAETQAASRKEKAPKNGDLGWTVRQLDGDKLVWYSFRGEKFGAQQFVGFGSGETDALAHQHHFLVSGGGRFFLVAVTIVIPTLAGCRHIGHSRQHRMLAYLFDILLRTDRNVKQLTQHNHCHNQHKADHS